MKKKKSNILILYTLFIFAAVVIVSVFLEIFFTNRIKDFLITMHVETLPEMVNLNLIHHKEVFEMLDPESHTDEPHDSHSHTHSHTIERNGQTPEEIFGNFLTLSTVVRVKVFSTAGTIVWSDNEEVIGKNYSKSTNFQKAMSGEVIYAYGYINDPEHATDNIKVKVLEIYIPLTHNGKVRGVIEIYENNDDLFKQIEHNILFSQVTIAAAGLILYIMLFFLFYGAYQKQRVYNKHIEQAQDAIIFSLGYQAELRDKETGRHLERTSLYVKLLTEELAKTKYYSSYISKQYVIDLIKSSPLHDIGKIIVPDNILKKPGKLTAEEFEIMKEHCSYGYDILKKSRDKLSFRSFLDIAMKVALYHHEKWDGTGYPEGLAGYAIPLSARIMALADVYDALRTKRVYKDSIPHEKCCAIIVESKGTHFDPDLVDAFMKKSDDFKRISTEFADD